MSNIKKLMVSAAGGAGLDVDDVFSTNLYTGTNAALTVNTGLDQNTEGGMLWVKSRSTSSTRHGIWDTERTNGYYLPVNEADNEGNITAASGTTPFLRDGSFRWNSGHGWFNQSGDYVAWAFRKAPKFFDVVTYTGDGTLNRSIAHNLGVTPAVIILKALDTIQSFAYMNNWEVYHKDLGNFSSYNIARGLFLNTTDSSSTSAFNRVETQTDTYFKLMNFGSDARGNMSGIRYVAYLFAHNDGDGGFGADGDADIIKCGVASYPSSGDVEVDLGFEPQWVLLKDANHSGQPWWIIDNMRGWSAQKTGGALSSQTGGIWEALFANTSGAEVDYAYGGLTATGFKLPSNNNYGDGNTDYIYIAIRRGPMAVPESGTEVFDIDLVDHGYFTITTPFPVDLSLGAKRAGGASNFNTVDRLRGGQAMSTNATDAEQTVTVTLDSMDSFSNAIFQNGPHLFYSWKRAPGFFDVVNIPGNGGHVETSHNHNLGVVPEMIIGKQRTSGNNWWVYHKDISPDTTRINSSLEVYDFASVSQSFKPWSNTSSYAPTATTFDTYSAGFNESSTEQFICYLFATLPGISKVGSYTGNGTSQTINCGFTSGARFILVKRTDSTGDWYVWDTERGIVAGNDPHLSLDDTTIEITSDDSIDPANSGFIVNQVLATSINVSSAEYIFYAIA